MLVDEDFDDFNSLKAESLDPSASSSKLNEAILRVLSLIFDVNLYNQQMRQFELDTDKLPLGKLSRAHILNAYSVLKELESVSTKI